MLLSGLTALLFPGTLWASPPFSEIVVFGDSLSDTGNFFLASNGEVAGPPYFEGRFSNGPTWVEVLAGRLGLPAPTPSIVGGTNYAWGGAETGDGLSFFGSPNVALQIESFVTDRGGFRGDELVVVAAGVNDLVWQPPVGPGEIVSNLRQDIASLAGAGARTFLVANSPIVNRKALTFNELLDKELYKLERTLGVTILRLDMAGVEARILLRPTDYGITDITDPACPDCGIGIPEPDATETLVPSPDTYFFWDSIHRTRVVHAIIGNAAADVLQP
jgi:phospholipase/lecithinase/hemolysin